jgi:FkbM family methyltransferase
MTDDTPTAARLFSGPGASREVQPTLRGRVMNVKKWLAWRRQYWRCFLTKNGEYELRILRRYVPRDRVAVDVGANEGVYAYHLSRYAHAVVAFEPNANYERSLRFLPRNVSVRFAALSSSPGSLPLHIPASNAGEAEGWATLEATDLPLARTIDVPVHRLDDLELGRVGFMKIDVEGHEMAVLAGASATIRRDRPVLLVEAEDSHGPGATSNLFRWASENGYRGWFFQKGRCVPVEDFRLADHQNCKTSDLFRFRRQDLNYFNNFLLVPEHTS